MVYVDDIIITGSNDKELQHLIHSLNRSFSLKDLGALSYFLGIEVQYTPEKILLSQKRYVTELLQRTKMLESNPLPTPMLSNLKLTRFDGDPVDDAILYRSVVGALQYATITRPEISFIVTKVS